MLTLSWQPETRVFTQPLRLGGALVPSREGAILTVSDGVVSGMAEQVFLSAPVWPLVFENYETFRAQLHDFPGRLHDEWPFSVAMALASFYASQKGCDSREILGAWLAVPVEMSLVSPIQGFLWGDLDQMARQLMIKSEMGMTCFKLKVGGLAISDEISRVKAVVNLLPSGATLRLDANRQWSYLESVELGKSVHDFPIEYIEEPLRDPNRLHDFCHETGLRVALDETIYGGEPWKNFDGLAAIVMKPGLMTWGQVHDQIRKAHDLNLPVVWSSCFESELGMTFLRAMASLVSPTVPAGLDTLEWLK